MSIYFDMFEEEEKWHLNLGPSKEKIKALQKKIKKVQFPFDRSIEFAREIERNRIPLEETSSLLY